MTDLSAQSMGTMGATEEQIELLDVAEKFCRERSPIDTVRALIEDDLGFNPDIWKEIGQLGWLAVAIPEAYDGVGLSLTEVVPIAEQMGRYMLHTPFMATTLAAQAIVAGGTETQKKELLPMIATGSAATIALCEENGDWDLENIEARAEKTASGYKLSGTKHFVQDAKAASVMIVSVKVGGSARLAIINAADIPDGALRREGIIDETKRAYELKLDGITIDKNTFLDADKSGETFAHLHLAANLLGAAEMCGGARSTIDYTVEYLKTRKQFGKLIGSFQSLKHTVVDAFVDFEKARSLLYAAAFSFDNQGEGEIAVRMAKSKADTAFSFAADRAIQFHGGFGFTYDCDAQLYRRRAIWHASQYGDAAYHRTKLADLLL